MPVPGVVPRLVLTVLLAGHLRSCSSGEWAARRWRGRANRCNSARPEDAEVVSGSQRLRAKDPAGHPAAGDRRRSGRRDRELSAEWSDDHGEKRLFQDLGSNGPSCFTCHEPQEAGRSARATRESGSLPTRTSRCSDWSTASPVPQTTSRYTRKSERPIACFWTKA